MAYVVFLQGLVSAYAKTMAATDPFGSGLVICAPSGNTDPLGQDPLKQIARDCCGALCQAAGSIGPLLEPSHAGLDISFPPRVISNILWPDEPAAVVSRPNTFKESRGPPFLSI